MKTSQDVFQMVSVQVHMTAKLLNAIMLRHNAILAFFH
jgi:hypothetical protein